MQNKTSRGKIRFRQLAALALLLLTAFITSPVSAAVKSYKVEHDGVTFTLDKGLMKIYVCKDDIIEVKYTIFDALPAKNSLVVNKIWQYPAFSFAQTASGYTITTKKLKITIDKATNAITYADLKGNVITSEDQQNKTMAAQTVAGINTYYVSTQFNSPADEALYGLGCHPVDSLSINYKGRNQDLAIKYMTGAIPVLLSTKGYGLLWDNYAASNFYGGERKQYQIQIRFRKR